MIAASTNFRAPDDAITKTWSPTELVSWGCFKVENHGTIIAISSFQSIKSKLTFAKKGLGRLKTELPCANAATTTSRKLHRV
jgi:hypothetical protein